MNKTRKQLQDLSSPGKLSRNYASQFEKSDKKNTKSYQTELASKAKGNLGPASDFNRNHPSQLH